MEEYCVDGDQEEWRRAAHKLKGSAANMGAVILSSICLSAEKSQDLGQLDKAAILESIKIEYQRLSEYLEQRI